MARKPTKTTASKRDRPRPKTAPLELKGKDVCVEWKPTISWSGPPREIHARRPAPVVPPGPPVVDANPSPPVTLKSNADRSRRGRS